MLGNESIPVGPAGTSRRLLARLRDVMAASEAGQQRLDRIVRLIAAETDAAVCSCYVMRAGEVLELFSTVGLNPAAIHRTRLRVGEGVVGDVAAHARPLALADARAHASFAYRPETEEDPFRAMLAVPILRGGRVRGVLVVQHREERAYSDEETELLETLAMIVAEVIGGGDLLGPGESASVGDVALRPRRLNGVVFNRGLGLGAAVLHRHSLPVRRIVADDPDAELARLSQALATLHRSIDAMVARSAGLVDGEPKDILESYRMIAEDRGWLGRIREAIRSGLTAEAAVSYVQNDTRMRMSQVADAYVRERLHDFDDLAYRLQQHLAGRRSAADGLVLPDDVVLVARSLGPAELLDYDRARVRALVLEEGSPTSHVAIVARALEIPVIGQIPGLTEEIDPLDPMIVDGNVGHVYLRPAAHIKAAFEESKRLAEIREKLFAEVRHLPSVSLDGVAVSIQLNCGLLLDLTHLGESGADGIGLFRTEIPFMVQSSYPDVPTQTELYRQILEQADGKPVVFRTLDVGGDKRLPYLVCDPEENPALGWRAIRMGLDRPAMLRQQLRALILAAAGRPLSIMFPMVANAAEFMAARRLFDKECARAEERGNPRPDHVRIGVMVEVPALLWHLPALLPLVDFVSVGSNDLTQYLFASDRANPRLTGRYDPLSPPMLAALRHLVEACRHHDTPLSLCGEMAGTSLDAMALIGIGFRTLSMAPPSVGPVKTMLRSLTVAALEDYLGYISNRADKDLRDKLRAFALDHGVAL